MKQQTIPMSREEMDSLILAADDKLYWRTLFVFAKTTGRRLGEVCAVKVKDIDFASGIAIMDIEKSFKRHKKLIHDNGTWEQLPVVNTNKIKRLETVIVPEASVLLKRYIREAGLKADDFVFAARNYRTIQSSIKAFAKRAGIKHNVTFHNFRHYFITELARKGWSHDKIQKLTGHSNIATLKIYDHTVANDLKDQAIKDIQ
jgi:integrase